MSAEVPSGFGKGGKKGKVAADTPPPADALVVHNSAFMAGAETGVKTDKKNRQEGMKSTEVRLSEELRDQYAHFLRNQAQGLIDLRDTNPKLLDKPEFIFEKQMLDALTDESGKLSHEQIMKFLTTTRGWEIANMALEQSIAMRMFALGLYQETNRGGTQESRPTPGDVIRTGEGQGLLNRFYHDQIKANMDKIKLAATGAAGVLTGAGIGGYLAYRAGYDEVQDIATFAGVGAGVNAALLGLGLAGKSLGKEGKLYTTNESAAALNYIKSNKGLSEYVRHVYGISVDSYRWNPARRRIEPARGGDETLQTAQKLQSEINQGLKTRELYYESIGVDASTLNRMAEEFLFEPGAPGGPEKTGTRMQKLLSEKYKPKRDIKDTAGRSRGDPAFCTGGATLDIEGNLARFNKARREVLTEMMAEWIDEYVETGTSPEGTKLVDALTAKITARESDTGSFRQAVTKENRNMKEAIDRTATSLQTERATVDAYDAALKSLESLRAQKETELKIPVSEFDNRLGTVNGEITRLQGQITGLKANRQHRIDTEKLKYATAPPKEKAAAEKSATEMITAQVAHEIEEKEKELARYEDEKNKIQEAKQQITERQSTLTEAQETTISYEHAVKKFQEDYTHVEDPARVGLTAAELVTMTQEELLRRVNELHTLAPAPPPPKPGWPKEENNTSEHRMLLVNAAIHARADAIAARDPGRLANPARAGDFDRTLTRWGTINENQWRTLNTDQINQLANLARSRRGPGFGWLPTENTLYAPVVARMKEEAMLRHTARITAMEQVKKDLQEESAAAERAISEVDFKGETAQLEAAKRMLGRQQDIFNGAKTAIDKKNAKSYGNVSKVVTGTPGYTEAEITANDEVAYYEYLDLLFGYKTSENREETFKTVREMLPPTELAQLLNDSLGLKLRTVDMKSAVEKITQMRKKGKLNKTRMRKALVGVMNRVTDKALALP